MPKQATVHQSGYGALVHGDEQLYTGLSMNLALAFAVSRHHLCPQDFMASSYL